MGTIKTITNQIEVGKILLPPFPSTRHINEQDLLDEDDWSGTEKIDGANMGFTLYENEIILRNRDHILRKGYTKDTPAKKQFLHAWNWATENKKKLLNLVALMQEPISVYGEWCYALHGIEYTSLPDYFLAFDIYVPSRNYFVGFNEARILLGSTGFTLPPKIYHGKLDRIKLNEVASSVSNFSNDAREGIYLKKSINGIIVDRIKVVREDYVQGSRWDNKLLTRQKVIK